MRRAHLVTFPWRLLGGVKFCDQRNNVTRSDVVYKHELSMWIQAVEISAVGVDAELGIEIQISGFAGVIVRRDPDRSLFANIKFNI